MRDTEIEREQLKLLNPPFYIDEKSSTTAWRRPIGCLKLQIIFRKRTTNHRDLLRKMTYKDEASHGSSPPCRIMLQFGSVNSDRNFSATGI